MCVCVSFFLCGLFCLFADFCLLFILEYVPYSHDYKYSNAYRIHYKEHLAVWRGKLCQMKKKMKEKKKEKS